ncbi:MAG: hypothetical protein ABR607_06420 [Pyrinomonadaceae bacterium]
MPVNSRNSPREIRPRFSLIFLAALSICWSLACTKSPEAKPPEATSSPEGEPHAITSISPLPSPLAIVQSSATPVGPKESSPPPKADEVMGALARVFNKAASLDTTQVPSFIAGDFNGDDSEDLAIVTRPNENSLAEINSDLANWTLEDPKVVPIPGTKAADELVRPKPVKVEKTDSLLTIIHGIGAEGWRNAEARQTFLLRNGSGTNMLVRSVEDLRKDFTTPKLPPLKGDTISEQMNGRHGIIFWTGAKYAWYPIGK